MVSTTEDNNVADDDDDDDDNAFRRYELVQYFFECLMNI